MSEEAGRADRISTSAGHLSMRIDGRPELEFQFAQQPGRLALSFLGTFLVQAALVVVLYIAGREALQATGVLPQDPPAQMVFLANQPGPGGGGGGGGNRMPDPPRRAEAPGKDKITVQAKPAESIQAKLEPPPVPQLTIPVESLSSGVQQSIGVIQAPAGPPTPSQGPGTGGGAGTGTGTGVGPGTGSGLGPGSGGGTGGGAYRPGSGIIDPIPTVTVDPKYTAEAAERRIEGAVWVELVVMPNGQPANVHVIRSLDSRYGLDQQAVRAAQQWRFKPGIRRADNQAVPVIVTIEIEFSIR
jgi:TonB family protein